MLLRHSANGTIRLTMNWEQVALTNAGQQVKVLITSTDSRAGNRMHGSLHFLNIPHPLRRHQQILTGISLKLSLKKQLARLVNKKQQRQINHSSCTSLPVPPMPHIMYQKNGPTNTKENLITDGIASGRSLSTTKRNWALSPRTQS